MEIEALEIKAGATVTRDWLKCPKCWQQLACEQAARPLLIRGGEQEDERERIKVLPWRSVGDVLPAERA